MITTFVKHAVKDFDSWKTVYDNFMPTAKEQGVRHEHVFRDPNSPDQVIVTHEFKSIEEANKFFNSQELKNAMQDAGVAGAPEIWFGEDIRKTVH